MPDRAPLLGGFLARSGWGTAGVAPLAGDASSRRYARLHRPDGATAILMDAPPETCGRQDSFVAIDGWLRRAGLSAPTILAADPDDGFLLLEDFGNSLYSGLIEAGMASEPELYEAAAEVLGQVSHLPCPEGLAVWTPDHMAALVEPAFTEYANAPAAHAAIAPAIRSVLAALPAARTVFVHRDFHAENLCWLPGRAGPARVGLLDFQDAFAGHPAYDLASLLTDARRDVPREVADLATRRFRAVAGLDAEDLDHALAVLSLQRNLRILGVFARLVRGGKDRYRAFLPRVRAHVDRALAHPAWRDVAADLRAILPAADAVTLVRPEDPCPTPR